MSKIPLPDPPLRDAGAGIALRPWGSSPGDAEALSAAWNDKVIAAQTRPPEDRSPESAARWISGEAERRSRRLALDLVVVDVSAEARRTSGTQILGEVGLAHFDGMDRAEIGFWLMPAARRRGVATVAVRLVTGWAQSEQGLGCRQLWARIHPDNERAAGVLSRAGYVRLGEVTGHAIWSATV